MNNGSFYVERTPLLPRDSRDGDDDSLKEHRTRKLVIGVILTVVAIVAAVLSILFVTGEGPPWQEADPLARARHMLDKAPIIVRVFHLTSSILFS